MMKFKLRNVQINAQHVEDLLRLKFYYKFAPESSQFT